MAVTAHIAPMHSDAQDAAGQMTRSPYSFYSIGSQSPLLWLSRSFAVLDGPTMPIIAEGEEEPNDTYVQQLTDSARAAIEVSTNAQMHGRMTCTYEQAGDCMLQRSSSAQTPPSS